MSSPLPPDPYEALGVPQDAEVSTIRTAYRKLVLIHHPDRIKEEALREKGKDAFQRIQQAYEILSDPLKKKRHDDRVLLAQLRKEKMMRDPPPRATPPTYTTRPSTASSPAAQPTPATTREYRQDGNFFEETRSPRNAPAYDDQYTYEDPLRTTSRKHAEYEKRSPVPKATEKKSKSSTSFVATSLAAQFASKLRTQAAEKSRPSKAEEKKSDREKRRDRSEKVQTRKTAYVNDATSESEYEEIRPSLKPTTRSKAASDYPRTVPSKPEKPREADDESGDGKWEKHHDNVKAYIKASNRPGLDRVGSDAYQYWASGEAKGRRSGSDNEKRPDSSKGRRAPEDYFSSAAPAFTKSTSSPSNLRAHVEERAPPRSTVGGTRDRDHRDRERDHRERETTRGRERDGVRERERSREPRTVVPPLSRSHTTPIARPATRKDSSKGSNLKHENPQVHDSGYGSSSSPHTPEMRDPSPQRPSRGRFPSATTSTKYQIVDPEVDDEENNRAPRVTKLHVDEDRYQRYHSPEPMSQETYSRRPERHSRDKQDRPRFETNSRSKSSHGANLMQEIAPEKPPPPPVRRGDSARYEERSAPRPSHDSPHISRHDSGREKLFREVRDSSPDDRYTRPYPEKVSVAPRRDASAAKYASYTADIRDAEHKHRFGEASRSTRRPSIY